MARGDGDGKGEDRGAGGKAPAFSSEQVRFYDEKVRPLLETRCFKCHSAAGKAKGGLKLDDRASVLKGGELGPAVTVGQPDESLLLRAIRYDELEMPPGGKLPPGEQEILTRWVKDGLPFSHGGSTAPAAAKGTDTAATAPASPRAIAAARREWSHRPVERPNVPAVKDRGWLATRSTPSSWRGSRPSGCGRRPRPTA